MRRGISALLVACAALVAAAPAEAADYVGLGDSYSSGTGTADSYTDNCERNNLAYPSLIDAGPLTLPGVSTTVNLSCSGARTNHITTDAQGPGNAQAQVLFPALGTDSKYVTLEIGGNDAGFVDTLVTCGNPFGDCDAAVDEAEEKAETELPPKLAVTYDAVRAKAPNAIILVVGYPRIFKPNASCNTFFSANEVNRLNDAADQLDALIRQAAHAKDLAYVSAIPQFIGHGACDAEEWINGLGTSNGFGNSYHPKAIGHSSGYAPIVHQALLDVPNTTITPQFTSPSNSTSPSFQLASTEPGSTFQCKLDAGAYSACTSPKTYTGVGQGNHTVTVRAVNPNGDVDQTPATYSWTIDTTPPVVDITGAPDDPTNSDDPSFEFSVSGAPQTVECRLDAGSFGACVSPKAYEDLTDGTHTFTVRATDAAGNTSTDSHTWTIDATAPQAQINENPADPTPSTDASFEFSFDDPGTEAECRLDGDAPGGTGWEDCGTGGEGTKSYTGLGEGEHTFEVRGLDALGNEGPADSYSWTIDGTATDVQITSRPDALTNDDSAEFEFTVDDPFAITTCSLDGGAFEPCVSTPANPPADFSATGLDDGAHAFTVRATDLASNEAEATYSWTVDTTAPVASISDGPAGTTSATSAEFSFGSDDPAAVLECRRYSGTPTTFQPCDSPEAFAGLGNGTHTFEVRATDQAGNVDLTPASRIWTVDTVPPGITIGDKPDTATNETTATFTFTSEAGASFQCRFDSTEPTGYEPCPSPKSYTGLADGQHSFDVRAVDAVGNVGSSASHSWTVDATAPVATIRSHPPEVSPLNSAAFTFDSDDPGADFECRLDSSAPGDFHSCPSPQSYTALGEGAHSFDLRAEDAVGNTGPVTSFTWISDTLTPTVTIGSGPTQGSLVNSDAATFGFSANEPVTVQCKRDTQSFGDCDSPTSMAYSGLSQGSHTFTVRATDVAGHVATDSRTWTVDTIGPTVTIDPGSGPTGAVSQTTASFSFTSSEPATQCSLDTAAFSACTSPRAYSSLAEGAHEFRVRSTDAAGNETIAHRSWTVDTTPPTVSLTSFPPSPSTSPNASFAFFANEAGSTFECSLDGVIAACTSPKAYTGLGEGNHSFKVRAIDLAGNKRPFLELTAFQWTVDLPDPPPSSVSPPAATPQGDVAGTVSKPKCKKKKRARKRCRKKRK